MERFLDEQHLQRNATAQDGVEWHPLRPFLPAQMRVLFLGSFPPPRKRWCMDFFYPNYINDHWRIEGLLFFSDPNRFVDAEARTFRLPNIVSFLREKGIGFFDTALAVRRLAGNASDKMLEVVQPTDIAALIRQRPTLRAIATTGEKACQTICGQLGIATLPKVGQSVEVPDLGVEVPDLGVEMPERSVETPHQSLSLWRLPSSSRAYPLPLQKKAEAYRRLFQSVGLLP